MSSPTISTAAAVRLAHAFAAYTSIRVIDLDTEDDYTNARGIARYLRSTQIDVGVELVETDKLTRKIVMLTNVENAMRGA